MNARRVNGGDTLELCTSGGWLTGRFEWAEHAPPESLFSVELQRGQAQLAIVLPEGARLRWPTR